MRFPGSRTVFLLIFLIFLTGCDLLYPPLYYDKLVKSNSGSGGGGGGISWQTVGNMGSASSMPNLMKIQINNSGEPVTAYFDNMMFRVYLNKYSGGTWSFTNTPQQCNSSYDMALDAAGTPYIVCNDTGYGGSLYNYSAPVWNALSNAFESGSSMNYFSLTLNASSLPVFAYLDSTTYFGRIMEWDGALLTNFVLFASNVNTINKIFLKYDPDSAYYFLAYYDYNSGLWISRAYDLTNFDFALSSFTQVETNDIMGNFSMAVSAGNAYIVYRTYAVTNMFNIIKYNGVTNSLPPLVIDGNYSLNYPAAAVDSAGNAVYIACWAALTNYTMSYARVYAYNGSVWAQLGEDLSAGGSYNELDIAVAPDGKPYVFYTDYNTNDFKYYLYTKVRM